MAPSAQRRLWGGGAKARLPAQQTDPVMTAKLRIGTRGSPLALRQTEEVCQRLKAAHGLDDAVFEIVAIKTSGDAVRNRALAELGGKELFTREIEEALLEGRIDAAVHSTKDMPSALPAGLVISCFPPREDARDALIARGATRIADLPQGATIGTASLRRAAQARHARPDLKVVPLRGNVETRLKKIAAGEADATFLACAGLNRLGLAAHATPVSVEDMLPAVGQGAICVETRADDDGVNGLLAAISDTDTADCVRAERAFLAALDGSCHTPIAGLATLGGDTLTLRGAVFSNDGARMETVTRQGPRGDAVTLGQDAGAALKAVLPADFFGEPG